MSDAEWEEIPQEEREAIVKETLRDLILMGLVELIMIDGKDHYQLTAEGRRVYEKYGDND